MKRARSAAQIAASRRNGARSRGPKSALTKARSACNAVTHGLFRARSIIPSDLPGSAARLVDALQPLAAASMEARAQVEAALIAAARYAEASDILAQLRTEITARLDSDSNADPDVGDLIAQMMRFTRYQRRFRRERDRALLALLAIELPESPATT